MTTKDKKLVKRLEEKVVMLQNDVKSQVETARYWYDSSQAHREEVVALRDQLKYFRKLIELALDTPFKSKKQLKAEKLKKNKAKAVQPTVLHPHVVKDLNSDGMEVEPGLKKWFESGAGLEVTNSECPGLQTPESVDLVSVCLPNQKGIDILKGFPEELSDKVKKQLKQANNATIQASSVADAYAAYLMPVDVVKTFKSKGKAKKAKA